MSCIVFNSTCPASGDTEAVLVAKLLQAVNSGGGVAGVSSLSINGGPPQTGAVSIVTGGGGVVSVNGDVGPAVVLDSSEIAEGASNFYYSAARFNTSFAAKTTTDLAEGTSLYFTEARVRATVLTGLVSQLGAIAAADSVLVAFGKTQGRLAALEAGTAGPFVLKAGDTMSGALLITPSADNVVPLTLTTTAGSATTTNALAVNYGAALLLSLRNDGRLVLNGRIAAVTVSSLGHGFRVSDVNTATAVVVGTLGHNLSAGVGAVGMGSHLDWTLDSSTTADTRAARQSVAWTVATHATRTASHTFLSFNAGTEGIDLVLTAGQVQSSGGTAALPAFSNRNDPDTGSYFPAANTWGVSTNGVLRFSMDTAAVTSTLPILVPDGSLAAPSLAFSTQTNTGFYHPLANEFRAVFAGVSGIIFSPVNISILSSSASLTLSAGSDVVIRRDAPAVLALSNTTVAAQTFRITEITDAGLTNYSRLSLQTQAGNHLIRTEAAGTGTLRILQVGTGPKVGTDIAGINTIFHGGQSTGAGAGGSVLIQTSPAGGAGAAVNALVTKIEASSAGIGFFATAAAAQQVSGANLTNNVTAGGTDNTVDNWTDLTLYATDAAAIRNAVYQLARKLKQVNDALRLYGLLT